MLCSDFEPILPPLPPSKDGMMSLRLIWGNLSSPQVPQNIQLAGQHRDRAVTAWLAGREKGKNIKMSTNLQLTCYLVSLFFARCFFLFFTKMPPSSEDTNNKHGYMLQLPEHGLKSKSLGPEVHIN